MFVVLTPDELKTLSVIVHTTIMRSYWCVLFPLFPTGSRNRWHHQEADLLCAGDDQASQGGARGRGQGEAQDGLRPGHVWSHRGHVSDVLIYKQTHGANRGAEPASFGHLVPSLKLCRVPVWPMRKSIAFLYEPVRYAPFFLSQWTCGIMPVLSY